MLDCDSGIRMEGPVVPVVTDVPVSPSSVVTEFVMNSPGIRIGNLLNRRPLLSPRSAHWIGRFRRKR